MPMMSIVIFLGIVLLFFFFAHLTESHEETTKEKIGDAISQTAIGAAKQIDSISRKLTEPQEKKRRRLATEALARKNAHFVYCRYTRSKDLESYLVIDDAFREALTILGLGEKEWKELAIDLFFHEKILEISFLNDTTRTKETEKSTRKSIIENEIKYLDYRSTWGETHDDIVEALNHFNIAAEEWIEYGYVVLAMHHICEDEIHRKFGVYL